MRFGSARRRYATHDRSVAEREPTWLLAKMRTMHASVRLGRLRANLMSEHTSALHVHQRIASPESAHVGHFAALDDMTMRRDVEVARLMLTVQAS